jgi:hypothetical protein
MRKDNIGEFFDFTRIYSAGKVWHAPLFREMRELGYNVATEWINWGSHAKNDVRIWEHCLRDATKCDLLIIYCGDKNEEQRGAMVEIGHAIAAGNPVYCIGTCHTLTPNAISDVAVTHHKLWHWTEATTIKAGYREAVQHFIRNYAVRGVSDLHYSQEPAALEVA